MSLATSLADQLPLPRLRRLEQRIGYEFRDAELLREALVHGSYLNEHDDPGLHSNERLEFLGDAILGSIVARELFDRFPDAAEGWLTEARSLVVRNDNLGAIAAELDLGAELVMGAGISNLGARDRPVVLACSLEALIGAIWLDGGQRAVQKIVRRLVGPSLDALARGDLRRDPKSVLQEQVQSESGATPRYTTLSRSGPPHDPRFRVEVRIDDVPVAEGCGSSKQAAQRAAAQRALSALSMLSASAQPAEEDA